MTEMAKGANVAVAAQMVRATLFWTGGPGVPDVDGSALLLQANGKVGSDDDMVFYNQPQDPSGSVRQAGTSTSSPESNACYDVMDINLAGLPASVEQIALVASADGGTFGEVRDLRLVVSDLGSGAQLATFTMTASTETAFITGEFYRRDAAWKFRTVGQGYSNGLSGLATDFGIQVGDGIEDAAPVPAAEPSSAPPGPLLPPPSWTSGPPVVAPPLDLAPAAAPPPPVLLPAPAPPVVPPAAAPFAPPAQIAATGPVNLVKNQSVDLSHPHSGPLDHIVLTLGWSSPPTDRIIDLDACVIGFNSALQTDCIVSYKHPDKYQKALRHGGDVKGTAQGGQYAERIYVELSRLPAQVASLVFTISSFRGQTFTDVSAAYCSLGDEQGNELVRFDLTETQPSTAVLMALIRRTGPDTWNVRSIGEFHDCRTVRKLVGPAARQAGMP